MFGLVPCYLYIYCLQITLLQQQQQQQNEAPNHDTGCGSGNNYRAGSQHSLQPMPTGHSSTTVRPEL
jgi:hypothetical protein